ncbi:MAG: NADH-quinone oxidoreductase subunit J [Nitrospiraceae bacterium]|nr:MAG: NADH-quinone oxidoreductase subunit J [Nitrospiraceae bacterium]
MTAPQVFFSYFAAMITGLSLLVVTRKNPVHSVLWMLLLFVHIAGLYLFLNAEFLAAIQIIIYAGAILVLFLFVIMLLNLRKEETEKRFQRQWPLGLGIGVVLMMFLVPVLGNISVVPPLGPYSVDAIKSEGHIMTVGKVLYTEFLLPFEIASVILLVAIVGAVVLAKRRLE